MQKEIQNILQLPLFTPFGRTPIILKERFDKRMLNKILNNPQKVVNLIPRTEIDKKQIMQSIKQLKKYKKFAKQNNSVKCKYQYFDASMNLGRLENKSKICLQNAVREIRQSLTHKYYDDIDIKNAQPTLLNWLCKKLKIKHFYLSKYVKKRNYYLNKIAKQNNMDRSDAKVLIIHIMNGGTKFYKSLKIKNAFIKNFYNEMQNIHTQLCFKFPISCKKAKIYKKKENVFIENYTGTLINVILTTIENHVLMGICEFFKRESLLSGEGILIYDSILIPKNKKNIKLLKKCEKFIYKYFKIKIILKKKKMDEYLKF